MNITTKAIKSEVESCRAAEAELAKLRLQKSELEAGETQAKATLNLSASGSSALDNQINLLSKQRAKIEGLSYEITVREQALANRHALLRNYGVTLIGEAKARYDRCRQAIMSELNRRLAPFMQQESIRKLINDSHIVPLRVAFTSYHTLTGHVMALKTDPTATCELILRRYEEFMAECMKAEALIGK